MDRVITHNMSGCRFELKTDDHVAYIRYLAFEGGIDILSTQVPPELEGQGIASALTEYALEYARSRRLKVIATCSFTVAYLHRHPEYAELTLY